MREPSPALLIRLRVVCGPLLGGRCNQHWLVDRSGTRMVLRRWADQPWASIEYERGLLSRLAAKGWPVAPLEEPVSDGGALWSLAPYLPGEPFQDADSEALRLRGRLLAEFHAETMQFGALPPRPGWRRCEEILRDRHLDQILSGHESRYPEEFRIVRWHLDRARTRAETLDLQSWPSIPVHGDFAAWNLRFSSGRLVGLLDFELARQDHRIADFALAWRGHHDDVVRGYEEVSALSPQERAAIVPVWWSELIEGACRDLRAGRAIDRWTIDKLLVRSPFMGPDAKDRP